MSAIAKPQLNRKISVQDELKQAEIAKNNEKIPQQILCVHPHFDLVDAIPELKEKYDVTYVQNGFEALQHYYKNKGKFDIIISGIIMSQMDGFSFISRIRKITKKAQVYMLIDSNEVDNQTKSFFKELNVRCFFSIKVTKALKNKLL